jgi:hypothetical protein
METKLCCKCHEDLPLGRFKTHVNRKDGLQGQCINCQKQYRREHYLANRQKYINKAAKRNKEVRKWWVEYKSNLKCTQCPEDHPAVLQFHHTDPSTKDDIISRLATGGSKDRLLQELRKCIVLCANCHFKLHYETRGMHV